jgi:hypothetical protein
LASKPWSEPASRPQLLLTLVLALLAAVACQLMLVQAGAADRLSVAVAGAVLLGACLIRPRLAEHGSSCDILLAGCFALAFLPPPLGGVTGGTIVTFRVLVGLRNVALAAAVLGNRPRAVRIAALTSTVLVLIGFSLGSGLPLLVVAVLYAGAGVAWLVMTCWREFAERLPSSPAPARAPWSWALSLGLLGGISFLAGVLFYPAEAQGLLQRFAGKDSAAEARKKARAYARQPANRQMLGTLANEKYGAADPNAIPEAAPEARPGPASGAGAGGPLVKRFPLVRQPREDRPAGQRMGRVLFQIKERGAGHVPMVTYSRLEGAAWELEWAGRRSQVSAEIAEDRSWRSVLEPFDFYLDPDAPDLADASADRAGEDVVERSRRALSKFAIALQGGGRMLSPERTPLDRSTLEQSLAGPAADLHPDYILTPYDYSAIRRQLLRKHGDEGVRRFESSLPFRAAVLRRYLAERRRHPRAALPSELRTLLDSWVGNRPRGWGQIDAVIQGLRAHARHDPETLVPAGEKDPIRYFLLVSRRGPDYLFATAATILLRHLDYPSRMVGGFYVRPGDYRLLTGSTPVTARDLHYWTQVYASRGLWINLEPTPGYEPSRPAYTLVERLSQAAGAVWQWLRRRWPVVLAVVVFVVAGLALRRRLAERLATLWWWLRRRQAVGRLVRATWRLIERRARTAGQPRPPGVTLPAWSVAVGVDALALGPPLAALAEIADWITHAPTEAVSYQLSALSQKEEEIRTTCRRAVRHCTIGALRPRLLLAEN